MKAYYGLPSGTYTLILSMDDLQRLLTNGRISMQTSKVPCTTGRAIFDHEKSDFETLDEKKVWNDLLFHTDTSVSDIEAGDHYIQFMHIVVEDYDTEAI